MKFLKPWCRKGRGWYVTLEGRQISLGQDKEKAFEEYRGLLAQPRGPVSQIGPLLDLVNAYLVDVNRIDQWLPRNGTDIVQLA